MSVSQALATVDEMMESSALAPRVGFLEPRCRICRRRRDSMPDMPQFHAGECF
jgi:hypothetical protein